MKQKLIIPVILIAFMLILTSCGTKDTVSRFTEANPGNGESIDIPGYESLTLQAGSTSQKVYLFNPEKNSAYFVMTLTLENGDTIWKGKALYPGEAFTDIILNKSLEAGDYAATLHYDCFSVSNKEPLNGADIELNLTVHDKD